MSQQKDDDHALKPKDVLFTLAIALNIDAQSKADEQSATIQSSVAEEQFLKNEPKIFTQELANEIHSSRHVYYAYSVLDSLSSSYSMFKYFFDMCLGGSTDDMHNAMLTPVGIVAIIVETCFLVGFSFLACHFDGKKEEKKGATKSKPDTQDELDAKKRIAANKKYIVEAWGYFRNVIKGLKNAYKGWRSAVVALSLLGIANLSTFIMPVGLLLGVIAAGNRYLMRSITEERKKMMKNNGKTLSTLIMLSSLKQENIGEQLEKTPILKQDDNERYIGFLGSAIAGFVDGLYLYVGALTLTLLAPQLLIAMASFSAFYTIACIITRIYEEYDFQLKLVITQTKCELALITKQLQTCYAHLLLLEKKANKTPADLQKLQRLKSNFCDFIEQFDAKRKLLQQQQQPTWLTAVLVGIKNGLYAYGALSSVLFLVGSLLTIAGVAFPPLAIALVVASGVVFIAGFMVHAMMVHRQYCKEQNSVDKTRDYQTLINLKRQLKEQPNEARLLTKDELIGALKQGLSVESVPASYFQEWFEVFRSFFSGLGKGQKFIDFAGNPLQEQGADGHYHDTPLMYVLGALSALLFAFVLALRALARGFGRSPLGEDADLSTAANQAVKINDVAEESISVGLIRPEPAETPSAGESIQPSKRNDSPKSKPPPSHRMRFFEREESFNLDQVSSDNAFHHRP